MKNDIPSSFQVTPMHSRNYLIQGQLRTWEGDVAEVYSPIRTLNPNGEEAPTLLGTVPDMETETALEALEAAKTAYNRGQGLWPTMKVLASVLQKICCFQLMRQAS